jgi:hypothetical protein
MFEAGEREVCPHCDVALADFAKLPPSHDAQLVEDPLPVEPQHEPLDMKDMRRGKGALLFLGLAGLVLFFLPWVLMTLPETVTFSGFDLSRRLGWSWAAACAWIVLLPTVLSRRSIAQLRGARVAATFLASIPAVTVVVLLARPPHGGLVPVVFDWGWPMYATLVVSLAASVISLRLGGHLPASRSHDDSTGLGRSQARSSTGHTLH